MPDGAYLYELGVVPYGESLAIMLELAAATCRKAALLAAVQEQGIARSAVETCISQSVTALF